MDRLTLPREQKTVDAGKCLPAGDSLPSWSTLPLDAKFPMVPTPKGTLTLFTTKYCTPKYRRKSSSDFDLTDPNGMSGSSEYHPLHDPHLRAHFNVPWMRRHLVRNGFITESGMVICNLKEFNKYRQYLRRICLMELMRDRKAGSQKDLGTSTTRMEQRYGDDVTTNLSAKFLEARRRQTEKIEKQRMKLAMMAKMKGEQMEKRRQEQMERQAEALRRRQEDAEKKRDTLVKNAEEAERRNLDLLRKWRRRDRQHAVRIEDMRRQRVLDLQRKNKDSWEMRKRVQQERMDREAASRQNLRAAKELDIRKRERYLKRQRDAQMAKLDQLKSSSRAAREERERICAARLARRIAVATQRDHRRYRKSPFRSEWTLQQVLRRLSFPELTRGGSQQLMQMLSAAIDEAVDRVTSRSDVDVTGEAVAEKEMRKFAADLVESVVTKVREEIYPAYLRLLETGGEEEAEDLYDDMYDQSEFELYEGTDDELNFSAPGSDDNGIGEKGSRSVRFSFDEAIIPVSMDSLNVVGLKPVSEHTLTPVPSPLPCDGTDSEFDFQVKSSSKPTKRESGLVESLLLRLLDDLNQGRLTREDLLKLTGYCIEVIKTKETREKSEGEEGDGLSESPSGHIANELVKFTLSKILDDIKSGSVSQEDLTALTRSIVKDAQNESGVDDEDLDRLISSALSSAMNGDDQDDIDEHVSDMMLEDFVTRTLSQVKGDMEDNKFTEEELREMGSAIVSAVFDQVAEDESLMAEDLINKTLHQVLEDAEADRLVGAVMDKVVAAIVSSYHTLTTKDDKSNSEIIEEFVTDILSQVVVGIRAGEYSEHELEQIISTKTGTGTKQTVQSLIDSLLSQIESGTLSVDDITEIGNVLVDTGRKLLAARGVPSSSTEGLSPEEMTSTEIAERVVKEVIENIQGEMEDQDFEKEALKALAASFLKIRSSSFEGFSNVPTVGSSRDPSYLSTMKPPSPTESSLAADVVLAAMARITRDLTERNIPVHMLSSIAFSIGPENQETPSIFISEDGLSAMESSSLPQNIKTTLLDITRLLKTDRVSYEDAKRIFGIILQKYLCRDKARVSSSITITDNDSRMIEQLINETINNVIRNVAADVSSASLPVIGRDYFAKLSSVISETDLEKFIWDTMHRIGQEASMESVLSRPSAPIHFRSHCSVDSQNVESLVRQTLIQVARDIGEGIGSDSSLVDTNAPPGLSSKVVEFVVSVLDELVIGLEKGNVSKTSVADFMRDICPDQEFKDMEVEKLHRQLIRVMEDVSKNKTGSVFFHVIADRFSAIKAHGKRKAVVTPEIEMIGNILSSVDANILTQFVQATLVAVLGGEQTPLLSNQIHPGSIKSLLKVESSVIARKVVDDVIARIERDISDGSIVFDEAARRDSSHLANIYVDELLSQVLMEVDSGQLKADDTEKIKQFAKAKAKPTAVIEKPVCTREPSQSAISTPGQSLSGDFSAFVLQTLKSVVSDLRLAQTQVSESGLLSASESVSRGSSSVLDDFIYKQLQQAVDSIQQMHEARESTVLEKPEAASSEEVHPATREASGFLTDVMNDVVSEMIVENVVRSVSSDSKSETEDSKEDKELKTIISKSSKEHTQDAAQLTTVSSTDITKFVLATLKHALSTEVYSYSSLITKESSKESSGTEHELDSSSVDSTPHVSKTKTKHSSISSADPTVTLNEYKPSPIKPKNSMESQATKESKTIAKEPKATLKESQIMSSRPSDTQTVTSESCKGGSTGVSELVAEVINQTIINIKDGRLSQDEMSSLVRTLSDDQKKAEVLETFILDILEGVKQDILKGEVSADNIENVALQIATIAVDKKDGSIKKQPSKRQVDLDSSGNVQSMVKDVLSHIVVSLSDEGSASKGATKKETPETQFEAASGSNTNNKNANQSVPSPCSNMSSVSPGVISDLADLSIRDSPHSSLEPSRTLAMNSFRSVIKPETADKESAGSGSVSQESDVSLESETVASIKDCIPTAGLSSRSAEEVKKSTTTRETSDVSVSSVDSAQLDEFVKGCLPKDAASLKSSSSDVRQKVIKKAVRTNEPLTTSKKSSVLSSKNRDGVKKVVTEKASKTSVPATQIDSCSSTSNTSSRTRMASSSCTTSISAVKQDIRSRKAVKKQEVKDAADSKVAEACGDARSTSSEASQCSSQADVMQVRSVCGSHTTQVRVRDSQSESSKE